MRHYLTRIIVSMLCLSPFVGGSVRLWADSALKLPDWPVIGVPIINYTPETSWEFGAAAQAYIRLPEAVRTSIIQLDGAWSLQNQWYINTQGTLYIHTPGLPWLLQFRGGYRNYPDKWYGTGNSPDLPGTGAREGTNYNSQRGYVFVQPLLYISPEWAIGPHVDFLHEQVSLLANATRPESCTVTGLGVTAQYDTRDIIYYPSQGIFFKAAFTHYWQSFFHATADLRQFIPLPRDLVIAWQFRADMTLDYSGSSATVPPQLLPTLGGQDLLRGLPRNMFRDDLAMAMQAEFRFPIAWLLRGVVFAGVGDVYNVESWHWSVPKAGYGLGLRLTLNQAKVNIRFDAARNTIYPSWSDLRGYAFYLTATESF